MFCSSASETRLASHITVPCKRGVDDDISVSPTTSVSNELPEISRMGVDSAVVDLANIALRLAELTDTFLVSINSAKLYAITVEFEVTN